MLRQAIPLTNSRQQPKRRKAFHLTSRALNMSDYPGQEVVDCDVDNWVGKKCTMDCDDVCLAVPDATEVYESGGWQEIHRKIVVGS